MQQGRDNDTNSQQSYFYVVWPDEKPLMAATEQNTTATNKQSNLVKDSAEETDTHRESSVTLNYEANATYTDVSNELMLQKTPQQLPGSPIDSPNVAASTQTSEDCTKQDSTITLQAPVGTLLLATNGSHSYCTLDGINSVPAPDLIMSSVANFSTVQSVSSNQKHHMQLSNATTKDAQSPSLKNGLSTTLDLSSSSGGATMFTRLQHKPGSIGQVDQLGGQQPSSLSQQQQQQHHHHARKQRHPQARHSPQRQGDSSCLHEIGVLAENAIANLQKITSFTRMASKSNALNGGASTSQNSEDVAPPSKRPCSRSTSGCLECEVKDAEIQILRRRLHGLKEEISALSSATQMAVAYTNIQTLSPPSQTQSRSPPMSTEFNQLSGVAQPSPDKELLFARRRRHDSHTKVQDEILQHTVAMSSQPSTSDYVELTPGSNVYIPVYKLDEAKREAKTGTQLARKLMDVFWDKDTLARSTLTPKSKFAYQQLDPKTIKAIEAFCLVYDATVHSKDIHATMTDKCCQARSRYRTLQ